MDGSVVFADLLLDLCISLAVVAAAVLPLLMVVRLEQRRLNDPVFLCEAGVVVKSLSALDGVSEVAGRYMGADIYREVAFKGVRYVFDRIVQPGYERFVTRRELYLAPGIVYLAV